MKSKKPDGRPSRIGDWPMPDHEQFISNFIRFAKLRGKLQIMARSARKQGLFVAKTVSRSETKHRNRAVMRHRRPRARTRW
jgi:hypothetical protein